MGRIITKSLLTLILGNDFDFASSNLPRVLNSESEPNSIIYKQNFMPQ